MYFPASHLSHSPSLPSVRLSEYSPLLSFPRYYDADGALVSSPSAAALSSSSASLYLRLCAVFVFACALLLVCGLLFFHPPFAEAAVPARVRDRSDGLHSPQSQQLQAAEQPLAFPLVLLLLLFLLLVIVLLLFVHLPRASPSCSVMELGSAA
jgi:hypothetical protein